MYGGTCIDRINSYMCECVPGYTGANCQHRINPCDSSPCLNGAACTNKDNVSFACHCPAGFAKPTCDVSTQHHNGAFLCSICIVASQNVEMVLDRTGLPEKTWFKDQMSCSYLLDNYLDYVRCLCLNRNY